MDERTNGPRRRPANGVQRLLLVLALLAAGLLLILPLTMIFAQVAAGGWALLIENLSADYLHHAFGLTLLATLVTIPVNLAFGLAFAWCVTHYRFRGRRLMLALIDIPYATSPVVAGLCYLLLYGAESVVG
ncbi:MAG: sulfate/thiosulfate ABC transporter permease CysW, partial [Lautropia sp.]